MRCAGSRPLLFVLVAGLRKGLLSIGRCMSQRSGNSHKTTYSYGIQHVKKAAIAQTRASDLLASKHNAGLAHVTRIGGVTGGKPKQTSLHADLTQARRAAPHLPPTAAVPKFSSPEPPRSAMFAGAADRRTPMMGALRRSVVTSPVSSSIEQLTATMQALTVDGDKAATGLDAARDGTRRLLDGLRPVSGPVRGDRPVVDGLKLLASGKAVACE